MVNKVSTEIRGGPGAGWYWTVRSQPPNGTMGGMFVVRSGWSATMLGAWWKVRKATRSATTTVTESDVA